MRASSGSIAVHAARPFRRTSNTLTKKSYTRTLGKYTFSLLDSMTISDMARQLRMSWHTIKEMDRTYLGKKYGKMRLCDLRYLAIDEIAYKKGHRYKTIVYDLEGRKAMYV
jgi:transposase